MKFKRQPPASQSHHNPDAIVDRVWGLTTNGIHWTTPSSNKLPSWRLERSTKGQQWYLVVPSTATSNLQRLIWLLMAYGYLQLIVRARHMPAANCQLLALPTFQTAMRTSSGLRWLHFALGHKPEPESESIYLQEVINLIHQQSTNRDLICINIYFDTQQSLQNQKPLVFLGVPSLMFPGVSLVFPGVSLVFSDFHGVSSCSTENVLGKDHLSQRNHYKNFFDYKML